MTAPETRWTPELQADVKRLALGGLSYSEIGKLHKVSRSAIGGIVRRMRDRGDFPLFCPPKPKTTRGPKPKPLHRPKTATNAPWSRLGKLGDKLPPSNPVGPARPISSVHGRLLTDLEPNTCKFSIGYDAEGQHLFCGAATEGSSWCLSHSQRVYQPRAK